MDTQTHDRRRATRFHQDGGLAVCMTAGESINYQIEDTSRTGVALTGPRLEPGTEVSMRLWWPMIGNAEAKGIVCRQDPGGHRMAIRYTDHTGLHPLLRSLARIRELQQTGPSPLFCGNSNSLRLAMEELEAAELPFHKVNSPLGALDYLQDPWRPISAIVFSRRERWLEFAAYLGSEHTNLHRVALGDERDRAHYQEALEQHLIDEILFEPWARRTLHKALRVQLHADPCLSCGGIMQATAVAFCGACLQRSRDLSYLDVLGGSE